MHELIKNLQDRQLIWRGLQPSTQGQTHSTGYPELDNQLNGAFPRTESLKSNLNQV